MSMMIKRPFDVEMMDNPSGYLTGRLLVAMPSVQDGCFNRSVIYVCAHNAAGAMGIIVNSAIQSISLAEIMEQLSIPVESVLPDMQVHFGGPVDAHRGFVLHSDDVRLDDSLLPGSGIAMTANINILKDMAQGKSPRHGFLTLGYAGWESGQLEAEIEMGSWIVAPASGAVVFEADNDVKWSLAAASLGIADFAHLSYTVGHA